MLQLQHEVHPSFLPVPSCTPHDFARKLTAGGTSFLPPLFNLAGKASFINRFPLADHC